ncbi:hypothetical protein CCUS01_08651 [Colletotrichum cuscutae]|uniref:PA14 domain-containing protein n=1 Tax=Colletotrichum cuscutae TaxID=1209917 RepID=A0AAI9XST2_9PEZI|nr:hypothetical protein CCUS01_08651 [Colletotrichum cuscutae]
MLVIVTLTTPTGFIIIVVSTGTQAGVTTLPQTDPTGTTTVVTFVPLVTGGLITLTSTGTQTGVTTIIPTDPAGTTSVITFVPPITGFLTTVISTATQTGLTTITPTGLGGTTSVITFVNPSSTSSSSSTSTTTTPGPTYSCDAGGYLIQNTTLYRLNLTTGVEQTVAANIGPGGQINAIGYNILDNFIYGITPVNGVNRIIRIASDGRTTLVGPPLSSNIYYNAGDIDILGRYWVSSNGEQWVQIDMNPASSTFGQEIATGTSTLPTTDEAIADWVYVPGGGDYLYSLTTATGNTNGQSALIRWSLTDHTWTTVRTYAAINGNELFGALYASSNSKFYASDNRSGNIYEININSGQPRLITAGPVSSLNDGARCVYAADPDVLSTTTSTSSTTSSSTTSITGFLTTVVSTGTQTGLITITPTGLDGTTSIMTFVPPSTTSTTSTSATTAPAACTPLCSSGAGTGLTVKTYPNPFGTGYGFAGNRSVPNLSGVTPLGVSSSTNLSMSYFNTGSGAYLPGSTRQVAGLTVDANNFTATWTGYFEPPLSGSWRICTLGDDEVSLFLGNGEAFTCGNSGDSGSLALAANYGGGYTCSARILTAGLLYPYRAVYGQIRSESVMTILFQPPGGQNTTDFPFYLYPEDTNCVANNNPQTTTPLTTSVQTSTTSKTSTTSTSTTSTSPTASCTPGLEWAFYQMVQAPTSTQSLPGQIPFHDATADGQANWKTTYFNVNTVLAGQSPIDTGTTLTIGYPQCLNTPPTVYGKQEPGNSQYTIIQHIGYFHPTSTGNYVFNLGNVDDAVYLWLGSKAISSFSNGNADLIVDYYETPTVQSFTFAATAGSYVPIRILQVNAQGCSKLAFYVTDPSGASIVSETIPVQNQQLTAGCPGSTVAPPFSF